MRLEPLHDALLAQAQAEADRLLAEARERAAALIAEAERRGAALVERARAEGAAAAAMAGAHDHARARRRARTAVLVARRELYDELCRQATAAARRLRDDPGYRALLERLSAAAREQLGEDAVLEVDPVGAGGVRGAKRGRHVDYTLDALVERCLGRLGGRVEELWA